MRKNLLSENHADFIASIHLFPRFYTVEKKVREFPVPRRDVTTKLSLGGINDVITELFLPRRSLVSDIPARDGKLVNLFYGVYPTPTACLCLLSLWRVDYKYKDKENLH